MSQEQPMAGDHVELRDGCFYSEGNEISEEQARELGWRPTRQALLLIPEEVIKGFLNRGDTKGWDRADKGLQAIFQRLLGEPTTEEKFEADHREGHEGLLVRTEDIKTGEVQAGFLDENGDYLIMVGPKFEVAHTNVYPGTETTQLTIKRRTDV